MPKLVRHDRGEKMLKEFVKNTHFGIALFLIASSALIVFLLSPIFGNRGLIVRSGSMSPAIKVGDLVIVKAKTGAYQVGDVISFKSEKNTKTVVTHRIIAIETKDNSVFYKTKGDANNEEDKNLVPQESVIGKGEYILPYVGKVFSFAKTKQGFGALVLFPAALVILLEAFNLIREVKKVNPQKYRERYFFTKIKPIGFHVLIPIVITILMVQSTWALLTDSETSTNNIFTASNSFPHLVINEVSSDGNPNEEWVEIFNPTNSSVNISSWKIEDGNSDDTFPTVPSIPANGYAVIIGTASTVTVPGSAITITLGNATIGSGLNNAGDLIRLKTSSNQIIDEMSYGNNATIFPSPPPAPGTGQSIARSPNGIDTNASSDWVLDTSSSIGVTN